jgi:hypothetical protein
MGQQMILRRSLEKLSRLVRRPQIATIVQPTQEEADDGLRRVQGCIAAWKASPALFVEKPEIGVIVSFQSVAYDDHGFALKLAVIHVLVAPTRFDANKPIEVSCVWNQPYMSFDNQGINAPYCFYLHFGAEGVRRARELWSSLSESTKQPPPLGLLRGCFDRDIPSA